MYISLCIVSGGPGVHHSVGQLLPAMIQCMPASKRPKSLHLVHRLDKETTGVMLLAKYVHSHL